jgi:MoxR-like ATPase
MQQRIRNLIQILSAQMFEREQIIALCVLAGVAGANSFLYGAPGTAKSLISRRIAAGFEVTEYFEYLMNRFSTPEELFGPVSLKALKQDQYTRKTEHYLPKAEFAFLDEIWKASPAILNTLLTLLNEKTFKNGDVVQQVPLKVLISASNEIPQAEQGLDALYDRFILRLQVHPIQQQQHFFELLQAAPSSTKLKVSDELKIRRDELLTWREQIYHVALPAEVLNAFSQIREHLQQQFADQQIYISDRRWQRIAYLMKAAAFLNGRDRVIISDLFILKHCLWNQLEDMNFVEQILDQVLLKALYDDLQLDHWINEKEQLEQQILNYFYYTDDVYYSYLIGGRDYLHAVTNLDHHYKDQALYLALDKMGSNKDFFAIDAKGEEIRGIVCNFNGSRQCTLKGGYYGLEEVVTPTIKDAKGTVRQHLKPEQQQQLQQRLSEVKAHLLQEQQTLNQRFNTQKSDFDSIFVEEIHRQSLAEALEKQLQHYELQLQDCVRLEQLCQQ